MLVRGRQAALTFGGFLRRPAAFRRTVLLGLAVLALLAAAGPVAADDLGGLSGAYARAQQMVDQFRRTAPAQRPAGRDWNDYVGYSNQAQIAAQQAAQRLAEVEAQLASFDASTRAYLEQNTTPAERSSVAALMEAVARLQVQARNRQYELQHRVFDLRARMEALREQMAELDAQSDELRAKGRAMTADLARLQHDAAEMAARAERLEATSREASALADALDMSAADGRAAYWNQVGDLFSRLQLGTPRDYMGAVTPAEATTQRRVHRVSTAPTVIPSLAMPVSPAGVIALGPAAYAFPAAAAAAAPEAAAPSLGRSVDGWIQAATALHRAQDEVDSLLNAVDATQSALQARAEEVKAAHEKVAGLSSAVDQAAAELNGYSHSVEALQLRIPDEISRGLHKLGEATFWSTAQEGLALILQNSSQGAELAAHFAWLARSYTTLLRDDLPSVVDLLGPNPSEESQAKFDRLTHLTETYIADRETNIILAQVTSGRGGEESARTEAVESLDSAAVYRRQKANLDEFIRQTRLGMDVAKNKFVVAEADAALRVESYLGQQVERAAHRGHDLTLASDKNFAIDLMQPVNHPGFQLGEFSASLQRHLAPERGLDRVFIEFPRDLPADKRDAIRSMVDALPAADRERVVVLEPK